MSHELTNANLTNENLTNRNLTNENLTNRNLTNRNLTNGNLAEKKLASDTPASGGALPYSIANAQYRLPSGELISYFDSDQKGKSEKGGKPALVLLHGYCGSSAYWEKVAGPLAEEVRVIAPDARGHGASSAPAGDVYGMEAFAEDLEALLSHLGVQSAIVLGHSLGGYITLSFAERYQSRLAGFGLIHSTPLPDSDAARQNRDKAAGALRQDGITPFVEGLIPKLFAADHLASLAEEIQRCKDIGFATDSGAAAATALGMKARPDRSRIISGAKVPVLLVAGLKDGVVPPESTFSATGDHVVKAEVAEAGHMSMMEKPDSFVAEVKAFLSSGWGE